MKILILGDQARYEKYMPVLPFIRQQELVFFGQNSSLDAVWPPHRRGHLFVDAITAVPAGGFRHCPS